ncbi:MAG: ATP-binding protein [Candidatus Pacebacteria bacterium]|nr:ATP-binding protein [Candidatus Paceibacterota bacterium]
MQISLIEFSVENFKIFKDRATFSMLARKNDKHTFKSNNENLLKTSLIYGPNASGKTTLLSAFETMKNGIILSANLRENLDSELPYTPYLASREGKEKPVFFEVLFSLVGKNKGIYRYNFSFVKDHIVEEKLVEVSSNGNEIILFTRERQNIKPQSSFANDRTMAFSHSTREEALFLSTCAQLNDILALEIINAFRNINVISGISHGLYRDFTVKNFKEDSEFRDVILNYLKDADFCIVNGSTKEVDLQGLDIKDDAEGFSVTKRTEKGNVLFFQHPVYGADNKEVDNFEVPLDQESVGTQKFLAILGPIVDTLKNGKIIFIDEFDNSLHPKLTKLIVDLFESAEINKDNAQLIVTTHDTSLLSYKDDFIKDQFWFTEKDEFGSAKLFSLAEFKMRNDTEFSRKYLEGRFGALPFVSSVVK